MPLKNDNPKNESTPPPFISSINKIDSLDRQISKEAEESSEWTGAKLRLIREMRHLSIEEISQHTKISKTYLKAIESEDFGKLPAPVYIRGFVSQISKFLKLPQEKVVTHYMSRYADKYHPLSPTP